MERFSIRPVTLINLFFPLFLGIVIVVVGVPVATYHYFARDLRNQEIILNRRDTGLTLLDTSGEPFFQFYDARSKEDVSLVNIPQSMQDAVVASEDRRFFEHRGYSLVGIVRAFYANLQAQEIQQGGSTITQQLAKNAFLSPEKSYLRKYQEVVLAQEIEKRYTKKQILEMYLNSVYFGEGAFGVQMAAGNYFDKNAHELTLAESALLAAILPAPSALSPISGNQERAFERQKEVLVDMAEQEFISQEQYENALSEPITFRSDSKDLNTIAPHFAIYVRNILIEEYGERFVANSGMVVGTTLNRELQKFATDAVRAQVENLRSQNVSNASAVVIDVESRAIEAMVGSIDWSNQEFGKVNVSIRPRQPGSSFKPYVYAQALEDRSISLATLLRDEPTTFARDYKPQNYDRRFRGSVTVRHALANSLNVPAVEVMTMIGVQSAIDSAERFGITTLTEPVNYGPSLVLGTGEVTLLEHTNGYATFADNGDYDDAYAIESIRDRYGTVIFQHAPTKRQVLSPGTAYLVTSVLSDAQARRETFGSTLDTSVPAAVKTGTTDDYKDSWTMGYTPDTAVGVWVGNNDNKPMAQIAGSLGAAPIWHAIIEHVSEEVSSDFVMPETVQMLYICQNGLLVPQGAPAGFGRNEFFLQGTEPMRYCSYEPSPQPESDDLTQTNPTLPELQNPTNLEDNSSDE